MNILEGVGENVLAVQDSGSEDCADRAFSPTLSRITVESFGNQLFH